MTKRDHAEFSQSWCGARCAWMILQAHEIVVSFEQVRQVADPKQLSTGVLTLADVEAAIKSFGLLASTARCSKQIALTYAPVIALLDGSEPNTGHYVVLLGGHEDFVKVADPTYGDFIVDVDREVFFERWTGYAIFVGDSSSMFVREYYCTRIANMLLFVLISLVTWIIVRRNLLRVR